MRTRDDFLLGHLFAVKVLDKSLDGTNLNITEITQSDAGVSYQSPALAEEVVETSPPRCSREQAPLVMSQTL